MVKEKECPDDCVSASTLALMGRKQAGAGDLCKEKNHQQASIIGPQTMLSFSVCYWAEALSQGQNVLGHVLCNTFRFLE